MLMEDSCKHMDIGTVLGLILDGFVEELRHQLRLYMYLDYKKLATRS